MSIGCRMSVGTIPNNSSTRQFTHLCSSITRAIQWRRDRNTINDSLSPADCINPPSRHRNSLKFISSHLICQPTYPCVHLCSAQLLSRAHLACRHLHQGRSSQKHLCLLFDEDRVIAHSGGICAAGRRRAKNDVTGWCACLTSYRGVSEGATSGVKYAELLGKGRPRCLREGDGRKVVFEGNVGETDSFEDCKCV